MYSGSVQAVQFLSKAPRRHQETKASSSREATAKARGPMPRRRLQYPLYEDSAAARIPCPPSLALVPFTCLTGDEGRSRSSPCVRDFGVLPCSRACDHRARRRPAGSPPPTSRRLPSCRSCVCAAIRAGPWRCSSQWSCCLTPRQYPSRRQASSAVQGCGDPRRVTERTQPTPALWSDLDARTSDFF